MLRIRGSFDITRWTLGVAVVALLTFAAACGGYDSTSPYGGGNGPDQGVRVTPQILQLTHIGETKDLTADVVLPAGSDLSVIWESTDSTIASVDGAGHVTARRAGFGVFVTAFTHDRRYQSSANVSVIP